MAFPGSITAFGARIRNVQVPVCPRKLGATLMVDGRLLNETDLGAVNVTVLPPRDVGACTVIIVFGCVRLVGLDDVTVVVGML